MSRLAREISSTGLYHIVFRGVNKQHIFEEETDYVKIIDIFKTLKEELHFEIYAYCLMSNHVHLLLKEQNSGEISQIMKRTGQKGTYLFCQLSGKDEPFVKPLEDKETKGEGDKRGRTFFVNF